jgi:AcrR family transcriptional regulator
MSRKRIFFDKITIINKSFQIIKEEGLESFSARRLAAELKISPMTVYNYYKNLDEIKKEVIIKGFNIFYKKISRDLEKEKDNFSVNDLTRLIRLFAINMLSFAQENKGIYLLMFGEESYKFRKEHEVRPFFNFLTQMVYRLDIEPDKVDEVQKKLYILEIIVHGLIIEKIQKLNDLKLEEYKEYVDFSVKHLFGD